MKFLVCILTTLLISSAAQSDVENCIKDAETNGNHLHAVAPGKECIEHLKRHDQKKEYQSPSGAIKALGLKNMFYLTAHGETILMAGDQTKLEQIKFIRADEEASRVFVFQSKAQESSLATYRTDFVGNVAPLSYLESQSLTGLTNVSLLSGKDELALIFREEGKISFINVLADSRYKGEKFSPVVKRFLAGEESGLVHPEALIFSKKKELLYVLDSNRLLTFSYKANSIERPVKIYKTSGSSRANQLVLNEEQSKLLIYENSKLLFTLELD